MNNDALHFTTTHSLLPLEAQARLRRAAATFTPEDDPMARLRAIDQAIRGVKRQYPQHFTNEALLNYQTPKP